MACHGLFVQLFLGGGRESDERNRYRQEHIQEIKLILKSLVHLGLESSMETKRSRSKMCGRKGQLGSY